MAQTNWSASALAAGLAPHLQDGLRATLWPTRSLGATTRWFDELYLWTEGFQPAPRERSLVQLAGLEHACTLLEREDCEQVAVTLSFGTAERCTEEIDQCLQAHALVSHRLVLLLRGSIERVSSRYQLRAFADHLRALQVPVGLRVSAPRLTMELQTFDLLAPDFAKIVAPSSIHPEVWNSLAIEARVVGIAEQWVIASGLDQPEQVQLATQAGFGFGQGLAIRPPRPLGQGAGAGQELTPPAPAPGADAAEDDPIG